MHGVSRVQAAPHALHAQYTLQATRIGQDVAQMLEAAEDAANSTIGT